MKKQTNTDAVWPKVVYDAGSLKHHFTEIETLAEQPGVFQVEGDNGVFYFTNKTTAQQFRKVAAKSKLVKPIGRLRRNDCDMAHRTTGETHIRPWCVQVQRRDDIWAVFR